MTDNLIAWVKGKTFQFHILTSHCGITDLCMNHIEVLMEYNYRSVPQIRPPFCNLSLSTKRRGGLCAGCDDFSRDYAPLPVPVKHDLIVGAGGGG